MLQIYRWKSNQSKISIVKPKKKITLEFEKILVYDFGA